MGPKRRCRICRTVRSQAELVRWSRDDSGQLVQTVDVRSGRGFYSCPGTCTDKLAEHKERFKK